MSPSTSGFHNGPTMDRTPSKPSRTEAVRFDLASDQPSSPRRSSRIKKPPPITPRRFNRFFTPRLKPGKPAAKPSRKALRDLSTTDLNTRLNAADLGRPPKRRKLSFHSPTASLPSSPTRHVGFLVSSQDHPDCEEVDILEQSDDDPDTEATTDVEEAAPTPKVARYHRLGLSSRLTQMRLSGSKSARTLCGDRSWQAETADFYSSPDDVNVDNGANPATLPFCTTSCKTNSLVAVGDEEGRIRLIDSANNCADEFKKCHLMMQPHDNAIMDLEFSEDDYLLATASGDQTCQIIDVQAQKSVYSLMAHVSSVKKIQFQPGSKNVLVTCSRDGAVSIWDLRERPNESPLIPNGLALTEHMLGKAPIRVIHDAHINRARTRPNNSSTDPSITSLCFVSPSQAHLFATASSNDSVVKLWDIRAKHKYRNKVVPVSCTSEPKSHEVHRRFGIASMAISTDCSKFYTLCRDHTVYTYATSHLILGSAQEMSSNALAFNERRGTHSGLGPLYGFRHPSLQVNTFYNRLSVRKATDNHSELIAVGSSDECAVLFPTAERYLTKANKIIPTQLPSAEVRPRLMRIDSQSTSLAFLRRKDNDSIPIYYHGTPLVKGHVKEVTAVTWSSEGNLVTIADDLFTRCWREDGEKARQLRHEGAAERDGSGWAKVRDAWVDD